MEIKVGDKVRVREDAQKLFCYGLNPLWFTEESTVMRLEYPDVVVVKLDAENHLAASLPVPTEYLVNVEDEDKAKYGIGDRVRVLHSETLKGVYTIIGAEYREKLGWYYQINIHEWHPEIDLEPYAEPTEAISQEEALNEYDPAAHNVTPAIAYYDAYTADLAKEIALKVANKFNDPK